MGSEANTPFEKLPGTQINVPRLNLHKRPRHRRCPTSRDFVPWRFLDAGRHSAWKGSSCRRPKTCTDSDIPIALALHSAQTTTKLAAVGHSRSEALRHGRYFHQLHEQRLRLGVLGRPRTPGSRPHATYP